MNIPDIRPNVVFPLAHPRAEPALASPDGPSPSARSSLDPALDPYAYLTRLTTAVERTVSTLDASLAPTLDALLDHSEHRLRAVDAWLTALEPRVDAFFAHIERSGLAVGTRVASLGAWLDRAGGLDHDHDHDHEDYHDSEQEGQERIGGVALAPSTAHRPHTVAPRPPSRTPSLSPARPPDPLQPPHPGATAPRSLFVPCDSDDDELELDGEDDVFLASAPASDAESYDFLSDTALSSPVVAHARSSDADAEHDAGRTHVAVGDAYGL